MITTWSNVNDPDTNWDAVPDEYTVYDQITGSPIGLLLTLTYSSTVTHQAGPATTIWSEITNPNTTWTAA